MLTLWFSRIYASLKEQYKKSGVDDSHASAVSMDRVCLLSCSETGRRGTFVLQTNFGSSPHDLSQSDSWSL